jgi:hypothetical protein
MSDELDQMRSHLYDYKAESGLVKEKNDREFSLTKLRRWFVIAIDKQNMCFRRTEYVLLIALLLSVQTNGLRFQFERLQLLVISDVSSKITRKE